MLQKKFGIKYGRINTVAYISSQNGSTDRTKKSGGRGRGAESYPDDHGAAAMTRQIFPNSRDGSMDWRCVRRIVCGSLLNLTCTVEQTLIPNM